MMNSCTYHQNCPVCGRSLSINVTLLGRTVYCQHCGGGFVACDPCNERAPHVSKELMVDRLLERADLLLAGRPADGT